MGKNRSTLKLNQRTWFHPGTCGLWTHPFKIV